MVFFFWVVCFTMKRGATPSTSCHRNASIQYRACGEIITYRKYINWGIYASKSNEVLKRKLN